MKYRIQNIEKKNDEILTRYFTETCIPKNFHLIAQWHYQQKAHSKEMCKEELIEAMCTKIESMNLKGMLTSISFVTKSNANYITFSNAYWKNDFFDLMTGPNSLRNSKFAKRTYFLNSKSNHYWYKSEGKYTPGTYSRYNSYMVLQDDIPDTVWDVITTKLQEILPHLDKDDRQQSLMKLLDQKYKSVKSKGDEVEFVDKQITSLLPTLRKASKRKVLKYMKEVAIEQSDSSSSELDEHDSDVDKGDGKSKHADESKMTKVNREDGGSSQDGLQDQDKLTQDTNMSNTNEEEHMTVSHEVASTSGQPKLKTKKKSSQQIKSSAEDGESSSQAGYEEKGRPKRQRKPNLKFN